MKLLEAQDFLIPLGFPKKTKKSQIHSLPPAENFQHFSSQVSNVSDKKNEKWRRGLGRKDRINLDFCLSILSPKFHLEEKCKKKEAKRKKKRKEKET